MHVEFRRVTFLDCTAMTVSIIARARLNVPPPLNTPLDCTFGASPGSSIDGMKYTGSAIVFDLTRAPDGQFDVECVVQTSAELPDDVLTWTLVSWKRA